jgi:hypothetical protein
MTVDVSKPFEPRVWIEVTSLFRPRYLGDNFSDVGDCSGRARKSPSLGRRDVNTVLGIGIVLSVRFD